MKAGFIFILFVGVALLLHWYYVPYPSFWLDESVAVNLSYLPAGDLIQNLLQYQPHPPAYFFLLKGWIGLWGDTEAGIRFLSLIFFLAAIPGVYLLARDLFGKHAALFSLPLVSTNYFFLWYSHQARPYMLTGLLSALSLFFFRRLLTQRRGRDIVGYLAATVLGLYTGYWFMFVFFGQALILILLRREVPFGRTFMILAVAGLSFLPWAAAYLRNFQAYYVSAAIPPSSLSLLRESIHYLLWGQAWILLPVAGAYLMKTAWHPRPESGSRTSLIFICTSLFFPLAAAFLISQFVPLYTPGRREIVVVPALIVLAAYCFNSVRFRGWLTLSSILLISLSAQALAASNSIMTSFESDDRQFLSRAFEKIQPGDTVVLSGFTAVNFDYYARRHFSGSESFTRVYLPPQMAYAIELEYIRALEEDEPALEAAVGALSGRRIVVFLGRDTFSQKVDEILAQSRDLLFEDIQVQEKSMPTYIGEVKIYGPAR